MATLPRSGRRKKRVAVPVAPGTRTGIYTIEKMRSQGGFGAVYEARVGRTIGCRVRLAATADGAGSRGSSARSTRSDGSGTRTSSMCSASGGSTTAGRGSRWSWSTATISPP
jgi:hypothetical protein